MRTPDNLITAPPAQADHESAEAYALRVLRFIAESGTALCTLDQLKQADRFYPLIVWRVEACTAEASAKMQRRITKAIAEREAQIAQWFASHCPQDAPAQDSDQDSDLGSDRSQVEQPDPRDQALQLMRAALTMIMDPRNSGDSGKGGGSRVPVSPRPPKFPPSNSAAVPTTQAPTTRSIADFQF